jgi:hypothetical protein
MKRLLPVAIALTLAFTACSGKTDKPAGDGATGAGSSNEPAGGGGEVGSPILDGGDSGHYVPLKSSKSFDTLKGGGAANAQNGVLLSVKGAEGGPFFVAMEDDAAKYLRVNKGWQVSEIGRDPAWRPTVSAGVPHIAVGGGWIVSFRLPTPGDEDREGIGTGVVLEGYDSTSKTYYTATAIDAAQTLFTGSLHVVDDHSFSFVFADGPIDDERIPYIVRRTVDLTNFRFVDEAVDIGNTNRMVNATALDDGYLVDLQRPKSERTGVFVRFVAGATDPTLQLTMKEATAPNTIDGFRVEGAAKPLTLIGATGAKTALPGDFASAAVAGAVSNLVYLRYVGTNAKAISADGVALVDVTKGTVATAFDLSGSNPDAAGPPANAGWASAKSKIVVVGAPTG